MTSTREELVPAIRYTHDQGIIIEVQDALQQVIIPQPDGKHKWLGPFSPWDVDKTALAIRQEAKESGMPGLEQVAEDWERINDESQLESAKPRYKDAAHRFDW
jgi:hypothetical protein